MKRSVKESALQAMAIVRWLKVCRVLGSLQVLRSDCFTGETQDQIKYFFVAFEETTFLSLNRYVLFYENFMLSNCLFGGDF